ncbi:MAG: hypothetical protein OHK0039_00220 [Bacteroidia bacterium]
MQLPIVLFLLILELNSVSIAYMTHRTCLIFAWLLLGGISLSAADFYFLATEDHYFENPANWYPSYPGTQVSAGDRMILFTDTYFQGFDLHIDGTLELKIGAELYSRDGAVVISRTGLLDNDGTVLVHRVDNHGRVRNRISANIHLHEYTAHPGAHTYNACAASFTTSANLINEGQFDNYSHCQTGENLYNRAVFNQNLHSRLDVAGELVLVPGSVLRESEASSIQQGQTHNLMRTRNTRGQQVP